MFNKATLLFVGASFFSALLYRAWKRSNLEQLVGDEEYQSRKLLRQTNTFASAKYCDEVSDFIGKFKEQAIQNFGKAQNIVIQIFASLGYKHELMDCSPTSLLHILQAYESPIITVRDALTNAKEDELANALPNIADHTAFFASPSRLKHHTVSCARACDFLQNDPNVVRIPMSEKDKRGWKVCLCSKCEHILRSEHVKCVKLTHAEARKLTAPQLKQMLETTDDAVVSVVAKCIYDEESHNTNNVKFISVPGHIIIERDSYSICIPKK